MQDIKMEAAIFFDSYFPRALRQALQYAGDDGFVASMPQLLHARANASYDHIIWNTWFTPNSEENVVKTPQGNRVVVALARGGVGSDDDDFGDLGYDCDYGMGGDASITGMARYVAVAPRDVSMNFRDLDFGV